MPGMPGMPKSGMAMWITWRSTHTVDPSLREGLRLREGDAGHGRHRRARHQRHRRHGRHTARQRRATRHRRRALHHVHLGGQGLRRTPRGDLAVAADVRAQLVVVLSSALRKVSRGAVVPPCRCLWPQLMAIYIIIMDIYGHLWILMDIYGYSPRIPRMQ